MINEDVERCIYIISECEHGFLKHDCKYKGHCRECAQIVAKLLAEKLIECANESDL